MINIITTFSESGYNLYGKRWIESLTKYMTQDCIATIYTDFNLPFISDRFIIKNFNTEFPNHIDFKNNVLSFYNNTQKNIDIGIKTVKFSHKAFVINNELKNTKDGLLVWLDGDVETLDYIFLEDFKKILNSKFLACQTEKQTHRYPHIESGILIFDCSNDFTKLFQQQFELYYYTKKLFTIKKPYDGYVIGKVLIENKFSFVDFNEGLEIEGKNSSKDLTFQNSFLKSRFVHWIGTTKS